MKKVLIFTYLQRHLKKMLPIIQELEKNENVSLTLLLMTEEERHIAENNSVKYQMLDDYTDKKRNYELDFGWGLEPLLNAIDRIAPDLFCAIEVNYILRNAVRYCKQIGVKTVIIQHGTPNINSLHAFLPFEGNFFLAWGGFTRDFLVQHGMNDNRVILTGGIPFDRTLSLVPDREAIASELGIDADKKWIVFTTQGVGSGNRPSPEEIFIGVSEVAKALLHNDEIELIYQVHPSQEISYINRIVEGVPGTSAKVCRYHDTEELMKASHGVITFFSTTAIDAVLLKKPLILINLSSEDDYLPFVKMGVAAGAYSSDEIHQCVQSIISDFYPDENKLDTAAMYMNYMNDGNAFSRVMDVIYKILYSGE